MIRVCSEKDKEKVENYLSEEPYGRAIKTAIDCFGFDRLFQTVYADEAPEAEGGEIRGIYLWYGKNLFLYSKENQIAIDFLEQTMGIEVPEIILGREDNVKIVSWLLTDYRLKKEDGCPQISLTNVESSDWFGEEEHKGVWTVLSK